MLMNCPECNREISSAAISCPGCGYPINMPKPQKKRSSNRKTKRGNGTGTVYKLSGNRRNPWVAAKTFGWNLDEKSGKVKQIQRPIGYYPTESKANLALDRYNENPYDIDTQTITFSEVYDLWSNEYYKTLKNYSSARSYIAAFKWCSTIHNMRMRDIRVEHMQGVIADCKTGDSTKSRIKSMFNMIYKYCMLHEIVDKDYAALFSAVKVEAKIERIPYTPQEINILWENEEKKYVDTILFALYSGCRPMEVFTIRTEDVNLDKDYLRGGIKTEAGIDRVIPIHPKIKHIVEANYNPEHEFLFMNYQSKTSIVPMTYDAYKGKYSRLMKSFGFKHFPADPRHTFITQAKEREMNEYLLKLIVGHAIVDVTEKTYTHRKIKQIVDAVKMIEYEEENQG